MRDVNDFKICKHGLREGCAVCPKCEKEAKPIQFEPHEDITSSHHGGNPFSVESNPDREKKSRDMEAIYSEYVKRGPSGATRESVYLSLGFSVQTGSARCSDLARLHRIVPVYDVAGKRRRGQTLTNSPAGIECADIYGKTQARSDGKAA